MALSIWLSAWENWWWKGDGPPLFAPLSAECIATFDPEFALQDTQRISGALDLRPEEFKTSLDDAVNLQSFEINKARHFRNMRYVASTWDMQNQRISDSSFEEGRKIITFPRFSNTIRSLWRDSL